MKKVNIYEFGKNNAQVKLSYGTPPQTNTRIKDDCLWLEWKTQEGEKLEIGMRPDEALLVAEMLVQGVRLTTEGFIVSKPMKGYKIETLLNEH